jgi:hypothetical protein
MRLEDLIVGNHEIVGFDRRKSWNRSIYSQEIMGLETLLGANHGIGEIDRRKS